MPMMTAEVRGPDIYTDCMQRYGLILTTMILQVVNEFLEANLSALLIDGANIARKMYNRTFNLRTGKFSFDQFGSVMGSNYIAEQFDRSGKLSVSPDSYKASFDIIYE